MSDTVPRSWYDLPRILTRPGVFEGLSINDDFTDWKSDVPDLMAARRAVIAGTQESKRDNLKKSMKRRHGWRYGVRQDLRSEGTRGVAVVWDRLVAHAIGSAVNDPEDMGGGWVELIPAQSGLTARGVVWQDVTIRVSWMKRVRLRVASTHRPPRRDSHLWPEFDRALAAWEEDSPLAVVIFMDSNETGGPATLSRLTGLAWHGVGIDGALTDLRVPGDAVALERRHSDHKAVAIPLQP